MKQKPKELRKQSAKFVVDNFGDVLQALGNEKPKELDWKKQLQFNCYANGHLSFPVVVDFIDKLLTQQRTELLEEIKKIIEKHKKEIDRLENMSDEDLQEEGYESEGEPEYYCIGLGNVIDDLEKLINLLNKKDE